MPRAFPKKINERAPDPPVATLGVGGLCRRVSVYATLRALCGEKQLNAIAPRPARCALESRLALGIIAVMQVRLMAAG